MSLITGGDIFKTQVLLDFFMKEFNRPTEPVSDDDLARRYSQITTGQVLAATCRSISTFRAHELDLSYMAQIANRVSGAKDHSLAFGAIRWGLNGLPL